MTIHAARPSTARRDTWWGVAAPAAVTVAVLLLATASRYDLHGDELYFRMLPLDWWYDDQPPLTVWLSRLAAAVSDAAWVQRLPAVLAAVAGVVLAAAFPRLLGHGPRVQRVAAWAHGTTVYPLIVGHVFLTSSLDLLAWQAVILLVVAAQLGRRHALTWAGVVAGIACWNKLLVLVLVAALVVGLAVGDRSVLRTRDTAYGALALGVLGGPQVLAQLLHGMPMSQVSGALIAQHGAINRWLVLPLLVAFVGPPFLRVWWRGMCWRPRPFPGAREPGPAVAGRPIPVLAVAGPLIVLWNIAFPAQPYYAVAAFLPMLAIGWGAASEVRDPVWQRAPAVIATNAVVAVVLALPVLPVPSTAYAAVSRINPVARDQVGWLGLAQQMAAARRGSDVTVVTDHYALAGALAYHGDAVGVPRDRVASVHNALWREGPPTTERVLLVGEIARTHRGLFASCEDAGRLMPDVSDPFGLAGAPMARCSGPVGGWDAVWPRLRRLGG